MNQKIFLLDAAPIPNGDRLEGALLHAYHESWQLYREPMISGQFPILVKLGA